MRKQTTLALSAVAIVLVAGAAMPGTAQAADWSGIVSYYDSAELKGTEGFGIRGSFPINENWDFDVTGTYHENFRDAVRGSGKVEVGVIPIDFGFTWNREGEDGGFNAGGGLTYGFMDVGGIEIAGMDVARQGSEANDEFGFYAKLGWRAMNGFLFDLQYRILDVSIEKIDPAAGFPRDRLDLDMDGFVVSIGYRF